MLRLTADSRIDAVLSFCSGDPVGARVGAYLRAYRNDMPFAVFWEQIIDGEITAAVGKIDGNMTVCTDENADFSELSDFVRVIGFDTLFSRAETLRKLGLDRVQGDIMKFSGESSRDETVKFNIEPAALYALLCSVNRPGAVGDYLPWLSDFTFRERRNMLRAVGIYENNRLVSCALTSAETETDAVISGVATDGESRGKGYAKKCVITLIDELKRLGKENVFVMTEDPKLSGYYEKLGFKKSGEWGKCVNG